MVTAALLISIAIPVCAQRRSFSSPHAGASIGVRSNGVRSNGRMAVRGGIAFRHNPGFGVFFNPRPFHHRRSFTSFPLAYPYAYPYTYPYTIYPYYPLGLQSDFVYSDSAVQPAYMEERDTGLQNEVYRLQGEVNQLQQQQAAQAERQQYALNSPTDTPRPIPATRPRQEAPEPNTVLVYRDGHRVEIHNYAVVGQTLWVFSETRARKISLADLDLDVTRQVNEERGVEFSVRTTAPLPSK
ncbi:MAG: hypothetical protein LAN64_03070 [Acidobacteriia bacterium]|nr:hypothetical protein [Terriglobia bacterium]